MSIHTDLSRRLSGLAMAALALAAPLFIQPALAIAAEKVIYLFPAPPFLPAFGPIQLAQGKGYYKAEGLDVTFAVGKGGVDVAKQIGAGNAALGGILGDGPIIVHQNGIPIKAVASFGVGLGLTQRGLGLTPAISAASSKASSKSPRRSTRPRSLAGRPVKTAPVASSLTRWGSMLRHLATVSMKLR